ncbi:hypothetical protein O9992_19345 [Vibrio lentus]|nr:hypothetical protein [Vibrio lentus]
MGINLVLGGVVLVMQFYRQLGAATAGSYDKFDYGGGLQGGKPDHLPQPA